MIRIGQDRIDGLRAGKQKSLRQLKAHLHQQLTLRARFHALSDQLQIELGGKAHHRFHQQAAPRITLQVGGERRIHLEAIDRQSHQSIEAAGTEAKIVDQQAYTPAAQARELRQHALRLIE